MVEDIYLRKGVEMNKSFSLIDQQWKEFFLEDVVIINSGKRLTKADMKLGDMPFIGASEANNGITMFTSSSNESLDSNVLGVNYNGSVGFSFYHPYKALFSDDVKRVKWIDETHNNRYTLLFLSTAIRQQKDKYAYGYKFNAQRMKRQKVLLPVTKEGLLDWQFMEDYMKAKEQQILKPTIEKLCKQLIISNIIMGGKLSHTHWKEYVFGDEFSILSTASGIDKNKLEAGNGKTPYITRSDLNNGIDSFILEQKTRYKKDEGNVITIGLDTQTVFYQPTPFYTGQNIQIIRHPKLNRYNAMFLIVAIKKLVEKFSWGSYGATLTRLRKSRIYLPATETGEIDFTFMSSFMKEVEQDILHATLKFFKDRHIVNKPKMGG
ncbi:MAG: restriction endonuclease subunit S [Prevotella sp.]|nr:restriction endonuclease subunit S [Prevotella sp.]